MLNPKITLVLLNQVKFLSSGHMTFFYVFVHMYACVEHFKGSWWE